MRTATTVEFGTGWRDTVDFVLEAEQLGLDVCWVAEAWVRMRRRHWVTSPHVRSACSSARA